MKNKIQVQLIELEALAGILGNTYGTLKIYVARKLKNNEPLEFGPDGKYKLIGEPHKKWFAYDSEKYDITVVSTPPKSPKTTPFSTGVRIPGNSPKRPGTGSKKPKR